MVAIPHINMVMLSKVEVTSPLLAHKSPDRMNGIDNVPPIHMIAC
jgi:hypothetical protein